MTDVNTDHFTLTKTPVLKVEKTITSVDKHMEKLEPSHIAGLNIDGEVTVQNSVAVSQS